MSLLSPILSAGNSIYQWRYFRGWLQHFGFAKDFETGEYDISHEYSGLEFYETGNGQWLLEVTVGYGAYNGTYRYYFLDERKHALHWKEVLFRSLYWSDDDQIHEAMSPEVDGNAWFDPETNRIETFFKGRGIGDIGHLVTYDFRDGKTELISFRHKFDNDYSYGDEKFFIDPAEWPEIDISKTYPEWKR